MLVKNYEYDEPTYEEEINQERRDELIGILQRKIRGKDGTIPLHTILYSGKDSDEYLFMYNWLTENGIKIIGRNGTIPGEKYNFQEQMWLSKGELPEVLTREEEHKLFEKMNTAKTPEEKRAFRKEIIEKNIRLANWVVDCKITTDLHMPTDEMYSYVYESLIESVDKFDYKRTYTSENGEKQYYKFSSYAVPRMIFNLLNKREVYRSYMGVTQINPSMVKSLRQLQAILDEFSSVGVKPTIENLEEILSKPKESIIQLLKTKSRIERSIGLDEIMKEDIDNIPDEIARSGLSRLPHIDDTEYIRNMHDADTVNISAEGRYIVDGVYVEDENNGPFKEQNIEQIMDYNQDVEKLALKKQFKNDISLVLDTLTNREAKVLTLRLGLDGGEERTLEQVGEIFGLTRERIRQIEAKAFRKLRHPSRMKKIVAYLGSADDSFSDLYYVLDRLDIQDSKNFYITQKGRTNLERKEDEFLYAQDLEEARRDREKDTEEQNNVTNQLENIRVKQKLGINEETTQKSVINEKIKEEEGKESTAKVKNVTEKKATEMPEDATKKTNTPKEKSNTEAGDLLEPKPKVVNLHGPEEEQEHLDKSSNELLDNINSLRKAYLEYCNSNNRLSERKEYILQEVQELSSSSENIQQELDKVKEILEILEIPEAVEILNKKRQKYEKKLANDKKQEKSLKKELQGIDKKKQEIEQGLTHVKEDVHTVIEEL